MTFVQSIRVLYFSIAYRLYKLFMTSAPGLASFKKRKIPEIMSFFSDDFDMSPEEEDDEDMHLARLCTLDRLEQLSIASADFFGHLLFRL